MHKNASHSKANQYIFLIKNKTFKYIANLQSNSEVTFVQSYYLWERIHATKGVINEKRKL